MWMRTRNLFHPGSGTRDGKIRIQDKHPGFATLEYFFCADNFQK